MQNETAFCLVLELALGGTLSEVLQQIHGHPNIIGLVGLCKTEIAFCLVLELAQRGMLSKNIDGKISCFNGVSSALDH